MHLQSKANQGTHSNSSISLKNKTRNVPETPKDQTIRDIMNNLEQNNVYPDISFETSEFALKESSPNQDEKEIRLFESFIEPNNNLNQGCDKDSTIGSSDAKPEKEENIQPSTNEQKYPNFTNEFLEKLSKNPDQLRVAICMFMLFSMVKSKNPINFQVILKLWSVLKV